MPIKNFLSGKICSTLVIIQKFFNDVNNERWIEFVGLKSKMHSLKKINGKESNTAKAVNIATEFNKFKDVLFNKKIIRHKMRIENTS